MMIDVQVVRRVVLEIAIAQYIFQLQSVSFRKQGIKKNTWTPGRIRILALRN